MFILPPSPSPAAAPLLQLTLRTASSQETGTSNLLGDQQLVADIEADNHVLDALRACPAAALASSEEQPQDLPLGGAGYSIAYDPLDGSSIIGANWAVGCEEEHFLFFFSRLPLAMPS